MTWPLPELELGAVAGELSPEEELAELLEPPVPPAELADPPELELAAAWCVALPNERAEPLCVLAGLDGLEVRDVPAVAAPGRLNATAPAATRLAAVADTVIVRSRAVPRSRAAARAAMLCVGWFMATSVTGGSRRNLCGSSQPPMSVRPAIFATRGWPAAVTAGEPFTPPIRAECRSRGFARDLPAEFLMTAA